MTLKRCLLLAITMISSLALTAANKPQTVYVYGFAASFNDSTVYFTDIYQVDSAYVDSKTKFLYSRNDYTYQLRHYLTGKGLSNMTCVTCFAFTRKDAEKKFAALRKRYITGNNFDVNYINAGDFSYEAVKYDESKPEVKAEKPKKPKSSNGGPGGPGGGPGGPGGAGGPGGGMGGMGGGPGGGMGGSF